MATRKTSGKSTKKSSAKSKSSSKKTTRGTARKTSKRTVLEPKRGDRRFVRRNKKGEFKTEVKVGRSLAADRRTKAKKKVPKGQGDRGDTSSGGIMATVRKVLNKL